MVDITLTSKNPGRFQENEKLERDMALTRKQEKTVELEKQKIVLMVIKGL